MEQTEQQGLTEEESLWLAAAVMQAHVDGDEEGAEAVARLAADPAGVREAMAHAVQPGNAAGGGARPTPEAPRPGAKSMPSLPRLPAKAIPQSRFQKTRRPR